MASRDLWAFFPWEPGRPLLFFTSSIICSASPISSCWELQKFRSASCAVTASSSTWLPHGLLSSWCFSCSSNRRSVMASCRGLTAVCTVSDKSCRVFPSKSLGCWQTCKGWSDRSERCWSSFSNLLESFIPGTPLFSSLASLAHVVESSLPLSELVHVVFLQSHWRTKHTLFSRLLQYQISKLNMGSWGVDWHERVSYCTRTYLYSLCFIQTRMILGSHLCVQVIPLCHKSSLALVLQADLQICISVQFQTKRCMPTTEVLASSFRAEQHTWYLTPRG